MDLRQALTYLHVSLQREDSVFGGGELISNVVNQIPVSKFGKFCIREL
jgi:hypothetical protein